MNRQAAAKVGVVIFSLFRLLLMSFYPIPEFYKSFLSRVHHLVMYLFFTAVVVKMLFKNLPFVHRLLAITTKKPYAVAGVKLHFFCNQFGKNCASECRSLHHV